MTAVGGSSVVRACGGKFAAVGTWSAVAARCCKAGRIE